MECKHKWDFITVGRIGNEPIAVDRVKTALWICPYCEEYKTIVVPKTFN